MAQLGLTPRADDADRQRLRERKLGVLRLLAQALTAGQIGAALGVSTRTVGTHLENTYAKLGCHDRMSAVATGIRLRLLPEQRAVRR
jgi:DNA-binding NarL/FixJ family response regulator